MSGRILTVRASKGATAAIQRSSPRISCRRLCHSSFTLPHRGQKHLVNIPKSSFSSSATLKLSLSVVPGSILVGGLGHHVASWRSRQSLIQNGTTGDKRPQQAVMLASSSLTLTSQSSWIRRYWEWLMSWLRGAWKGALVVSRTTEVALRLSPLAILTPLAVLTQSTYWNDLAWRYTISAVQAMGPVAVKFCQWVATRRDIFPPHICDGLCILHDKGYPHSWDHTHQVLTEAFGDYQERGLHVGEVIGCGSAAQVYKGTLTEGKDAHGITSTRTVAIKVLHPKFSWSVERDLALMQSVADFLHSLPSDTIRMVNLPRATENFGNVLRLQADLTHEASNLHQFRTNFYQDDTTKEQISSISFPKPLRGWSSPRVLVEEYVEDAIPIATYLQDSSPNGIHLRRELAGPLLRAFLKMVFIDNFIHGDLHPGNVMVKNDEIPINTSRFASFFGSNISSTDDGNSNSANKRIRRTIVFLDAGIANSLSRDDQRNLIDLFRAVIFNDGNRAGRLMVERAKYERCTQVPGGVDAFAKGVEDIVSEFHDRRKEGLTLGAVRIGSLLSRVLDLCRVHGVEIDPAMASVVISTLVLEGLGRSLSPELNLLDFAKPFVMGRGTV